MAGGETQTWDYRIVAPQVKDKDGEEVRPKVVIAHGERLLKEPNEKDLAFEHHEKFVEAQRQPSEASFTIVPFGGEAG